jgi:transcriptional regulator with XRE-family HTH domain
MSDIVRKIGPAIAKRRKELDISLEEVARRAGTSKSHIWDLEKGNSVNPTITMLLSVASALNTSINTLLGQDISQPILSDDELELIQHHRRIFGRISNATEAALRSEVDKVWSQFVVQCESLEDRENPSPENEHAKGFVAGERYAAKSIRRSVAHPKYNKSDFPTYNGEEA